MNGIYVHFLRCFGLLLSPGKNVDNQKMHLLDQVYDFLLYTNCSQVLLPMSWSLALATTLAPWLSQFAYWHYNLDVKSRPPAEGFFIYMIVCMENFPFHNSLSPNSIAVLSFLISAVKFLSYALLENSQKFFKKLI